MPEHGACSSLAVRRGPLPFRTRSKTASAKARGGSASSATSADMTALHRSYER